MVRLIFSYIAGCVTEGSSASVATPAITDEINDHILGDDFGNP